MIENHIVYRRNDGYVGMLPNKLPNQTAYTELGRFPGYNAAVDSVNRERKVEGSWGMTQDQATTEAKRRWGPKAHATHYPESTVGIEHYRVGLRSFIGFVAEGNGRSWEEAFSRVIGPANQ